MSDKVRGVTFTKQASLLGGWRDVQASRPVNQLRFSLGFFSEEGFQVPIFILLKIFWWGGTVNCYVSLGSWHGMLWCQKWDSAVPRAFGAGILVCAQGAICFFSEAGCAASITPQRPLGLQWWANPLYFCLIR